MILKKKEYGPTKLFSKFSGPNTETTREALKLGVPIGFGVFVELSMFSGAALILGSLGATVISAHTVAINIASVFFILPLSFGLAAATRIGNLVGEKNLLQAKYASHVAVLICLVGAVAQAAPPTSYLSNMNSRDVLFQPRDKRNETSFQNKSRGTALASVDPPVTLSRTGIS